MKISARNQLKGKVVPIDGGMISATMSVESIQEGKKAMSMIGVKK